MGTDARHATKPPAKGDFVARLSNHRRHVVSGRFRMGPWMAKHAALSFVLIAALVGGIGCAEHPVVEQLPAANFKGPLVAPPPVVEAPKPVVAVKPAVV